MKFLIAGVAAVMGCGDNVVPAALTPQIVDIELAPLALSPSFSPDVHDYAVRCDAGGSAATLTVTDTAGVEASDVQLAEDQLVSVRDQYFIRCLPHDFPALSIATHPDVGTPADGWYVFNSGAFAIVLDTHGTPVWYRRGARMIDVDVPMANTISFMPDADLAPFNLNPASAFELLALDTLTSTQIKAVGAATDVHELQRLPDGNFVVLAYPIESHVDLTGLQSFGSDETIADCQIQVIDAAGNLVWSWLASDHVDPVQESLEPLVVTSNVVDVFHCNSVDPDASGNFLVSLRHANALFYIDRATGTVQWKLGGTATNKDGAKRVAVVGDPQGEFSMEHDARWLGSDHITMFDNHGAPGTAGVARGVEYALDIAAGQATFVAHLPGLAPSGYEGSFRRYADGSSVISWGAVAGESRVVTEYDAAGRVLFEVAMPNEISYRAIKMAPARLDITMMRATAGS